MNKALWRQCALAAVLVGGLVIPALAEKPALQAMDLFKIVSARAPIISPDNSQVAYLQESADAMKDRMTAKLHLIDLNSGTDKSLGYLGPVQTMRWLPDGQLLILKENKKSDGGAVLLKLDYQTTQKATVVTTLPTAPSLVEVSPKGTQLAYMARVPEAPHTVDMPQPPKGAKWLPKGQYIDRTVWRVDGLGDLTGYNQLFVMDLKTGTSHQLTKGATAETYYPDNLSWSSDGKTLFFSSNRHENWETQQFNTEIYAVDLKTGGIKALTDRIGPDFAPEVSPDGKWIAYLGFDDKGQFHGFPEIYLMHADGSGKRRLTHVGQDVGSFNWDVKSNGLYFSYSREGSIRLAYTDLRGNTKEVASDLAVGWGFDVESDFIGMSEFDVGTAGIVGIETKPHDPSQLFLLDHKGRKKPLTRLNQDWLKNVRLGDIEEVRYKSPDGTSIQGWLLFPPTYNPNKKYPVILEIHGGPDLAYGPQFSFRFQRYAAEGYVVFLPNYRGSMGYDSQFYDDPWAFPGKEYDDLMAGMEAIRSRVSVDPKRLYVTGLSAGGCLTAWVIGKTDQFAAAVVQSPVINWISHSLTQDLYSSYDHREFERMPWEDPEAYWKRSPLSLVGNVVTPTLIIQGSEDSRTPLSEGLQFYQALRLRQIESAFLILPGSFHIPTRPSQWIEEQAYMLQWFGDHRLK